MTQPQFDFSELSVDGSAILRNFCADHPHVRQITAARVARWAGVTAEYVARALAAAVDAGAARRRYCVEDPNGQLTERTFASPDDIPPKMRDGWDRPFLTEAFPVVECYVPPKQKPAGVPS